MPFRFSHLCPSVSEFLKKNLFALGQRDLSDTGQFPFPAWRPVSRKSQGKVNKEGLRAKTACVGCSGELKGCTGTWGYDLLSYNMHPRASWAPGKNYFQPLPRLHPLKPRQIT